MECCLTVGIFSIILFPFVLTLKHKAKRKLLFYSFRYDVLSHKLYSIMCMYVYTNVFSIDMIYSAPDNVLMPIICTLTSAWPVRFALICLHYLK